MLGFFPLSACSLLIRLDFRIALHCFSPPSVVRPQHSPNARAKCGKIPDQETELAFKWEVKYGRVREEGRGEGESLKCRRTRPGAKYVCNALR